MSLSAGKYDMLRFVLLVGVLGWGVSTAVIVQLIQAVMGDKSFFDGLMLSLIIFPIAGILFGYSMWRAKLAKSFEG